MVIQSLTPYSKLTTTFSWKATISTISTIPVQPPWAFRQLCTVFFLGGFERIGSAIRSPGMKFLGSWEEMSCEVIERHEQVWTYENLGPLVFTKDHLKNMSAVVKLDHVSPQGSMWKQKKLKPPTSLQFHGWNALVATPEMDLQSFPHKSKSHLHKRQTLRKSFKTREDS